MKKNLTTLTVLFSIVAFLLIGTVSCKPKDSDLQTAVETAIKGNPDFAGLTVSVKDGVATLAGESKSEEFKAKVEELAKAIKGIKNVVNNVTVAAPPPPPTAAPVVISTDEPLIKAVADAVKSFPGVTATVKDGIITLTGDIKRASLPVLMQALNTLKPKKIENKLTIK